ncbi:diacylglycerol kinase [Flavobacterium columnare]|uniref:Diacylglycerol kinase n=1 Tax=Flavobacterium columnare (strain ATCC 49512 / CIP 103533 / TG 44/87) TaxID=1041826 RepID=G8X4F5_FLACA|nr:diacylglycerol kinase family protein [Flavobacterium columnare]AEW85380.1 diacylglycerol kinase [Flavobacterium columnare ATCC 49512]MBF6657511.1 diacylglycerol kinase [Flavobacterium columnare]OOB83882.1 diacylglycerol kinase [Flavobacterium columnare]PDS23619.1 diacylglycerol kinase [Flavobacterium columnare] [Flavobacterium columnare NBRC 100251 = ATCC 23463]GEM56856.1 diacylglycerol kinase [Flavobacterium columnare NBRC 100251 = ATCC 23463]
MKFEKDETLFTGRLKSIGFAAKGAFKLITTEHSVMVQSSLAVLMSLAGYYFQITREEWMFQIFAFGLVLSIEGLNTAVEKLADFVHPDFHEKIGFIKDIAAGAVFFAAMTAFAIGSFIYLPKIL